jgi:transcriptional regulator with XRE-family HTH domain
MARGIADEGNHPVDRHVGKRVCEKRVSLGYNQTDLGKAIGVTFQQVQKYEKGSNRISASKLWQIADFFKVDIGYFFQGFSEAAAAGVREEGDRFDHDFPATRYSIELARIAPSLPAKQQKLLLDMARAMAGPTDEPDEA